MSALDQPTSLVSWLIHQNIEWPDFRMTVRRSFRGLVVKVWVRTGIMIPMAEKVLSNRFHGFFIATYSYRTRKWMVYDATYAQNYIRFYSTVGAGEAPVQHPSNLLSKMNGLSTRHRNAYFEWNPPHCRLKSLEIVHAAKKRMVWLANGATDSSSILKI